MKPRSIGKVVSGGTRFNRKGKAIAFAGVAWEGKQTMTADERGRSRRMVGDGPTSDRASSAAASARRTADCAAAAAAAASSAPRAAFLSAAAR